MGKYRSKGFQCPHCQGAAYTKWIGRANDGAVVVRKRQCIECHRLTTTFEHAAPPELQTFTISYWDEEIRFNERERKRKLPKKSDRASPPPRPYKRASILKIKTTETKRN